MSEERANYQSGAESRVAIYQDAPTVVAMPQRATALMPSVADLTAMLAVGEQFAKSGLMPDGVKTAAAVVVIMQKGRELGIPPMQAINGIHVIKGKATCSSDLMMALIYRDHGDNALRWLETTDERVTLAYRRKGWSEPSTFTWTKADTERAQIRNENNTKYPGAMLRARCVSAVARMAFNDTIGGMHLPSEIDAAYDDDGVRRFMQDRAVDDAAIDAPVAVRTADRAAAPATEADEHKRAMDALHAAGSDLGMDHDDIKAFIADRKQMAIADLGSMTQWRVPFLRWCRAQVEEAGRAWVQAQGDSDVIDADAREIDPDTGEVIPSVFPPSTLIDMDDQQPATRRDWTN